MTAQIPALFAPAEPPAGRPEPRRRASDRWAARPKPAILVVDDSEQDLDLIKAAFEETALEAALRAAQSGRQAQAYLEGKLPFADRAQHPLPALVLLDIQMPDLDGFELLRWLRAHPAEFSRVPVVMLSTSNLREDMTRSYELGANSYLVKPTTFEELVVLLGETARYWLERNRNA